MSTREGREDDLLARATAALRARGDEVDAQDAARRARARVLARAAEAQRARVQRRRRLLAALPFAAVLAAGTAFAARGSIAAAVHSVRAAVGLEQQVSVAPAEILARRIDGAPRPPRVATAPVPPPAQPQPEPIPQPPPVAAPVPVPAAVPVPVPAASSAPAPDPRAADLAAYKQAHALHFTDHDHARALPAWDAYLRAHPNGTFAIDARWNRALCLVRLGRRAEAQAALAPFARGEVAGGYRQSDARALLDALTGDAGATE
jgi:tetratricopeptide (TPR) repeat protein